MIIARMWSVIRESREWAFVESLGRYCWVEVLREQITTDRETQQEAEQDFTDLGFERGPGVIGCYDEITEGVKWVRYIVQHKR